MGDTITERFVDSADGVRIAVYEQGNPDGPTLVMAHGWPDSHVLWDGVVSRLADRFRIIRLRQPRRGQIICAETDFGIHHHASWPTTSAR